MTDTRKSHEGLPSKSAMILTTRIRKSAGVVVVSIGLVTILLAGRVVQAGEEKSPLRASPQDVEAGKQVYLKRCAECHGLEGKGDGPAAVYMEPRPRDFTAGQYKLRSTRSGELPTDDDLMRVVSQGIIGTPMPGWEGVLTEGQRRQVIAYLKTFFADFSNPDFDPTKQLVEIKGEPAASPDIIAKGKEVYQQAKCWECHGQAGRGDGPNAPTLKDDAGDRIVAADLTKRWKYKGGNTVRDIYARMSTGINGTPMPSYLETMSDEQRWQIAHYVRSLIREQKASADVVLKAKQVSGELPKGPDDPAWARAEPLDVMLTGQVVSHPGLQYPMIDQITVRALHNATEIAFLLEWNDRFKNVTHQEPAGGLQSLLKSVPAQAAKDPQETYPTIDLKAAFAGTLRDAVEVQFPVKVSEGADRPHFLLGDRGKPVSLWQWRADLKEAAGGKSPVVKMTAQGYREAPTVIPQASQNVAGQGQWEDGRWRVVLRRALKTGDAGTDVQFERGKLIPIAFHAWDGANNEFGLRMAVSSWYFLALETSVPVTVYLSAVLGMVLAGGAEWWVVRAARRPRQENGLEPPSRQEGERDHV